MLGLRQLSSIRRSPLLVEHTRVLLAPSAETVLLEEAEIFTEGKMGENGIFFGSMLFAIPLSMWCSSEKEAREIFRLVEGSVRVRLKLFRRAMAELQLRHPERSLGRAAFETRFQLDRMSVLIDLALEVPMAVSQVLSG